MAGSRHVLDVTASCGVPFISLPDDPFTDGTSGSGWA